MLKEWIGKKNFFLNFDYESLNEQFELKNAILSDGKLICTGRLERKPGGKVTLSDYLKEQYNGAKIEIDDITPYSYIVVEGINDNEQGQPYIGVYNENGTQLAECGIDNVRSKDSVFSYTGIWLY